MYQRSKNILFEEFLWAWLPNFQERKLLHLTLFQPTYQNPLFQKLLQLIIKQSLEICLEFTDQFNNDVTTRIT